jgi:hypothetical protein
MGAIARGNGALVLLMAGVAAGAAGNPHPVPLAFFGHPEVAELQSRLFGVTRRNRRITTRLQTLKERLKDELYRFIEKFQLEVLIPENILAIPMHVPLGLAMTEVLAETGLPTIAHHHDFTGTRAIHAEWRQRLSPGRLPSPPASCRTRRH